MLMKRVELILFCGFMNGHTILEYFEKLSKPHRIGGNGFSKTLLTIDKRGSKIARNSVFDCHLSPVGRKII